MSMVYLNMNDAWKSFIQKVSYPNPFASFYAQTVLNKNGNKNITIFPELIYSLFNKANLIIYQLICVIRNYSLYSLVYEHYVFYEENTINAGTLRWVRNIYHQ